MNVPKPRKLDSGSWFIQLRLGGESIPVTAASEKECVRAAQLIKAEYQAGKRKVSHDSITLSEAIEQYVEAKRGVLSPATIRGYECIKKNRFQAYMKKPLKKIDWQPAVSAEAQLCSAKTLKNSWCLIASAVKAAGYPVPDVTLPQVILRDEPYLEPTQIPTFVKAIHGQPCEIPALLALCSLRRSEICALTWEDIDLEKKRIHVAGAVVPDENHKFVPKETNKNQTSRRYVPIIIPELLSALEAAKQESGPVYTGSPNTMYHQIDRVCERAGLPPVGVHGLRRSFASLAYHLHMPERIAMRIGGWSNGETMHKIYIKLSEADIAEYANDMTEFYKNANENANDPAEPLKTQAV